MLTRRVEELGAFAICVLYVLTGARHVLGGDHAEFLTIAAGGGLAHPPGYPIYSMYLRLAGGSLFATSALQAPLMAGAAWLLAASGRALGASRWAAALAALLFALTPLGWIAATHAEVFALMALLAAGVMYAATVGAPAWATAGLMGLSLAHHHTVVFMLPLALVAWWKAARPALGRSVLQSVIAFVVGASPIFFMRALASGGAWAYGDASASDFLWRTLLRQDFGTFSLSVGAAGSTSWERVQFFAVEGTVGSLGLLWLGLGAIKARRWDALLSWLMAGPMMAMLLSLSLQGTGHQVAQRFLLLPLVIAVPFAALLFSSLRLQRQVLLVASAMAVVLVLAVGGLAVREHHRPVVEEGLRNTLQSVPPGSIVIGGGDHRLFGFLYLQKILHVRPDVTFVHSGLMPEAWYRARLPLPEFDPRHLPEVVREWQRQGKDVWLLDGSLVSVMQLPNYPYGSLIRLLRVGQEMPSVDELESLNVGWTKQHGLRSEPSAQQTTWAAAVQDDFARPYLALVRANQRRGDAAGVERNAKMVTHYAPWFTP